MRWGVGDTGSPRQRGVGGVAVRAFIIDSAGQHSVISEVQTPYFTEANRGQLRGVRNTLDVRGYDGIVMRERLKHPTSPRQSRVS